MKKVLVFMILLQILCGKNFRYLILELTWFVIRI